MWTEGHAFNVGGGESNAIGLLELIAFMSEALGLKADVDLDEWREGDQRYYVSETTKLERVCGWRPSVPPERGIELLYNWIRAAEALR